MKISNFYSLAVGILLSTINGYSSVVVSGNPVGGTGTLTFTSDITFAITSTDTARNLVFDEWTTDDGHATAISDSPPQSLTYSINGGVDTLNAINVLVDNNSVDQFDITTNDGYLQISGVGVVAGQTFTVKAGAYTFAGDGNFNPATIGTFNGSAYWMNGAGTRISDIVVVPEPAAYTVVMGCCLLGAGTLMRRRYQALN